MMTKEEVDKLMEPRIIVRHIYPYSAPKGSIYFLSNNVYVSDNLDGRFLQKHVVDACIADGSPIFAHLKWWEHRTENEMPKYVKTVHTLSTADNTTFPALVFKFNGIEDGKFRYKDDRLPDFYVYPSNCLPAIESDYIEWKNGRI